MRFNYRSKKQVHCKIIVNTIMYKEIRKICLKSNTNNNIKQKIYNVPMLYFLDSITLHRL